MYFVGIDISKFKHDYVNPLSSISFFQALPRRARVCTLFFA